jgi:hypothetical protein
MLDLYNNKYDRKTLKEYIYAVRLVDILKTYDASNSSITLHALPENQIFLLKNLTLIKGKLRRTRYFCREAKTGKLYLVAKNAQVTPMESNEL